MAFALRPGRAEDAPALGTICHAAFKVLAERHAFPPDFPSAAVATELVTGLLASDHVHSVVAHDGGRILGSNFLWREPAIAGVGPITIDPEAQDGGLGRRLMEAVLEHARERRVAGVRLVQAAYHGRSLALYAKLGFDVREPLANLQGPPLRLEIPGHRVRPAREQDLEPANQLCRAVHGHDRPHELQQAIRSGTAMVVEHDGGLTGYATLIGFFGHAVAASDEGLKALIGAAPSFAGPGFLLPMRNAELFRWCLEHGLRVVQPMTLMSLGLYNQPSGAFLPSVLF